MSDATPKHDAAGKRRRAAKPHPEDAPAEGGAMAADARRRDAAEGDVREFELKIALTEPEMTALRAHPALKAAAIGRAETRSLRSIYIDTPDSALRRAGLAVRLRRVSGAWVQTAKLSAGMRGGVSNPRESEAPAPDGAFSLERITDPTVRKAVKAALDGRAPDPVFETRVRRTKRLAQVTGEALGGEDDAAVESVLEIALDVGAATAGDAVEPLRELEIELKSGAPEAVFSFAKTLLGAAPVRLTTMTKAETGYRLAERAAAEEASEAAETSAETAPETPSAAATPIPAARAKPSSVAPGDRADAAIAKIIAETVDHAVQNAPVLFESDAEDGPHQFRVGLRRLRTALSLHAEALRAKTARPVAAAARSAFRAAGVVRDADVLDGDILETRTLRKAGVADKASIKALRTIVRDHRDRAREGLRAQFLAERIGDFVFDLSAFAALETWRPKPGGKKAARLRASAEAFGADALDRAYAAAVDWGARIETLSIEERHAMRKALKSLRYAVEFHRPLFDAKATAAFLSEMKRLQEVFGYLNDVAMAERLREIAPGNAAAEAVIAHHQGRSDKAWRKAQTRWRALAAAKPFWR